MGEMSREFGPFRIVRRLGVGGMAETFEVLRAGPGGFAQRCCMKRVLPAFRQDADFRASFLHEARLGAALRHANIVGVLDYGEHDGTPYIAMELIEGVDLRAMLASVEGARLPPEVVAWLGVEVARALAYAHAPTGERSPAAVVHRDVSPSNVLVDRAGQVKLADFGVAKSMAGGRVTATEIVKGKIPYMAPEQMRGDAVDGRADLFSLGVVLFEALTGRRPFDGANDVETMGRIQAGERASLRELAPEAPDALCRTIDRLLEIAPEARPEDGFAVVRALSPTWPGPEIGGDVGDWVEALLGGAATRDHVLARLELERDTTLGEPFSPFESLGSGRLPTRVATPLEEATTAKAGRTTEVLSRAPRRAARPRPRRAALAATAGAVLLGSMTSGALRSRPQPETPTTAERAPASGARRTPAASAEQAARPRAAPSPVGRRTAPVATPPSAAVSAPRPEEPERAESRGPSATQDGTAHASAATGAPAHLRVAVIPWGNVWIDGRFVGRAPTTVAVRPGPHRVAAGFDAPVVSRRIRARSGRRPHLDLEIPDPERAAPRRPGDAP